MKTIKLVDSVERGALVIYVYQNFRSRANHILTLSHACSVADKLLAGGRVVVHDAPAGSPPWLQVDDDEGMPSRTEARLFDLIARGAGGDVAAAIEACRTLQSRGYGLTFKS